MQPMLFYLHILRSYITWCQCHSHLAYDYAPSMMLLPTVSKVYTCVMLICNGKKKHTTLPGLEHY